MSILLSILLGGLSGAVAAVIVTYIYLRQASPFRRLKPWPNQQCITIRPMHGDK